MATAKPLGQFSVSLAVKDLAASRAFYERLGFKEYSHATPQQGHGESWLILQLGDTTIGLFQGMFERNTLTFNPTDVRAAQRQLEANGAEFTMRADPDTTGPAFAMLVDPDGNPVLLDQH